MLPLPHWFEPLRAAGAPRSDEPDYRRIFAEFARALAGVISGERRR